MIIGMVAMALLVVLAKFTGYFQYKYMKVQSALENTMAKKSSTKSVKFSGNEIFEWFPGPKAWFLGVTNGNRPQGWEKGD